MFGTFILRRRCGRLMGMSAVSLAMMVACFGYLFGCTRVMMPRDNAFLALMLAFMVMHFALTATVLMTTAAGC
ncbi:Uncharacterised protein [Mycobacterium tuberculosis]|nr:Uncharacterised protein [Mycobacterium tuberculosis]